jgi:hypothetical protein
MPQSGKPASRFGFAHCPRSADEGDELGPSLPDISLPPPPAASSPSGWVLGVINLPWGWQPYL